VIDLPDSALEQYQLAIQHECTHCEAKVGETCDNPSFPKYAHTDRMKTALMANGWSEKKVDARYNF
jgi:hypothetical protein